MNGIAGRTSSGRRTRARLIRGALAALGLASLATVDLAAAQKTTSTNPTLKDAGTTSTEPTRDDTGGGSLKDAGTTSTEPTRDDTGDGTLKDAGAPGPGKGDGGTSTGGSTTVPFPPVTGDVLICSQALTADSCRQEAYRNCPGKMDPCRSILQSGFEGAFADGDDRPRYQNLDDKNPLVGGRTRKKVVSSSANVGSGGLSSVGGIEARQQAIAQRGDVQPSAGYSRHPQWVHSKKVDSCEGYVYQKYYSYMRFVDAANSCKGDDGCVVDMAYKKSAGQPQDCNIADQTPYGRGATGKVPLPAIPLSSGVVPKNGFYTGAIFLTPALRSVLAATHPSWAATLDDVAARAYAGKNYYRWGDADAYEVPPVRAFANEFDYHKALRERTRDVPHEEMKANLRRIEHFEDLFSKWTEAAYCHGLTGALVECDEGPAVRRLSLLEAVGRDPWVRAVVLADGRMRNDAVRFALQGRPVRVVGSAMVASLDRALLPHAIANMSFASGPNGMFAGSIFGTAPAAGTMIDPAIVLNAEDPARDPSPLWESTLGLDLNNEWAREAPAVDTGSATPRLDCAVEASKSDYRLLACQATNALLDEITRDNPGCFDKGYAGCDWTPAMFAERFHRSQLFASERAADYERCKLLTSDSFDGIPTEKKANFEAFEDYLSDLEDQIASFKVPGYVPGSRVQTLGEQRSEHVDLIDPGDDEDSTFGGGYSYFVGWSAKPIRPANNQPMCRMDFAADATFKVWGRVFSKTANLVDAGAHLRLNEGDRGEASFRRKLIVLGAQLVPDDTIPLHVTAEPELKGVSEDYDLFNMTYPLPYGLYVRVKAGVELSANLMYGAAAKVPPKGECQGFQEMSAAAMVIPTAGASVYGSAYGGWLGIIEGGIEAEIDLIRAAIPITATGGIRLENGEPKLFFDLEGKAKLTTLSGSVDVCGCFTIFCGCKEVASWPGVTLGSANLFTPVTAEASLLPL